MTAVLEADALSVRYGGVHALSDASLSVGPGQLVGLIGPNGAGKTTFIDGATGFTPASGRVLIDGEDVSGLAPHARAQRGIGRTWQAAELFDDLTVIENLAVAAGTRSLRGTIRETLTGHARVSPSVARTLELLGLEPLADAPTDGLSQGQRKLVGVARALAADPRVVLLDEPAAGLDTDESLALGQHLRRVVASGMAMLLVDHDMGLVLSVCDHVVVLEFGRVIAAGTPDEVRRDPKVVEAYLGGARGQGGRHRRGAGGDEATALSTPLLEVDGLTAGYEGAAVVRDVKLHVGAGEVVALLGPNGAGKTTTLRAISGIVRPMSGDVRIGGVANRKAAPQALVRRGLGVVPEGRGIFAGLTVSEHLRLGRIDPDQAFAYFPALAELRERRAGLLSGGEAQMLSLACALGRRPKLLLVDELSLGLAPVIVERLLPIVRQYATDAGAGVLLVEQHVGLALEVADRGYVMAHGEIVLERPAAELREDRQLLVSSYLGNAAPAPAG